MIEWLHRKNDASKGHISSPSLVSKGRNTASAKKYWFNICLWYWLKVLLHNWFCRATTGICRATKVFCPKSVASYCDVYFNVLRLKWTYIQFHRFLWNRAIFVSVQYLSHRISMMRQKSLVARHMPMVAQQNQLCSATTTFSHTIKQLLHQFHKTLALCNIKGELASSFSLNIARSQYFVVLVQ